eukprot:218614_1
MFDPIALPSSPSSSSGNNTPPSSSSSTPLIAVGAPSGISTPSSGNSISPRVNTTTRSGNSSTDGCRPMSQKSDNGSSSDNRTPRELQGQTDTLASLDEDASPLSQINHAMTIDSEPTGVAMPAPLTDGHVPSPSGIITLNVGGRYFQTLAQTLKLYPRSYFGVWFSGTFRLTPEKDGTYFIDRNPEYFSMLLDYMRNNQTVLPDSTDLLRKYLLEAEFFRLEGLVSAIKKKLTDLENSKKHEMFRCRQCGNMIGNLEDCEKVNGQKFHTYSNPHGNRFNMLTVSRLHADVTGDPVTDGVWFADYAYKFVHCTTCQLHLGWLFVNSSSGHEFYGVIIESLSF